MKYKKLEIAGAYLIEAEPVSDERGNFCRRFCKKDFYENTGIEFDILQTNTSYNKAKGTIRGMHYLEKPFDEGKIVSCIKGKVFDVVVDLRRESPTYLKWIGCELSENNNFMIYIPPLVAHGFQTLVDDTIIEYKVNQYYSKTADGGVRYNDPLIGIEFPIKENVIISERDKNHPLLKL